MSLFLDHVNSVLSKLRETPVTALSSDVTTEAYKAQEAVQRAVDRIWNAKQWSFKMRDYSFATVAGQSSYPLFPDCGEIYTLKSSQHPYNIPIIGFTTFNKYVPDQTESGAPYIGVLTEQNGIMAQPATAGVVSISSTSASDTTQKVVAKGVVGGAYVAVEELSLAGTAPVSGSVSFSELLSVSKSDTTAGVVTATIGATTVAKLWPGQKTSHTRHLKLYPTPDAAYTITASYFSAPCRMTNAYEDTLIPARWDYVVDQFGFSFALQAKGQEQGGEFAAQYGVANKMLETDMAREEMIASDANVIPGDPTDRGSRGWDTYPAGYYPSGGF